MAESLPGFLYKTTSATVTQGVVGQYCAEWAQPTVPPPDPQSPEPPPDNPPPPDLPPRPPNTCPIMATRYIWIEDDLILGAAKGCFAIKLPADPSIDEWPANCGGAPLKVPDSYCGM